MKSRVREIKSAVTALIIVILVAAPEAQQLAPAFAAASTAASREPANEKTTVVDLLVGRSTILSLGSPIARVSLTVPDIADALVTAPNQLLVHGKQPGTISLFVWDRGGAIKTYEVTVRRDLSSLIEQTRQLFPGEDIAIAGSGKDVVLSGTVSSKYVIDKAAEVAGGYVEKKENVVNLLRQAEGVASNQVLLKVRFAEVSRNAMQELGVSLFSDGSKNYFGRTSTQQFPAPIFDKNQPSAALGQTMVFSDYLNLFLFDARNQLGAVVKAMQGAGVFQSLAEPNLIALNGKEASFLAGGEFPYPVPQGNFGSFTIQFKEYGVRLNFTPTVLGGDLINLKIKPEVSSLDFNNAVVIEGFRIPALTTRRAETEIELRDGQTFAIAGLLNNTALSSSRKIPGLGDIPVLGLLFKSRAYQKEQTELVVMVTPQIVRRDSTGASSALPNLVEPFLTPNPKPIAPPAPYTGSPYNPPKSEPAPAPKPGQGGTVASTPVTSSQPVELPVAPKQPVSTGQVASTSPQAPKNKTNNPLLQAYQSAMEEKPAATDAPAAAPAPAPVAPVVPKMTKEEKKALEQQQEADKKAADVAAKQAVEDAKKKAAEDAIAAKKAEEAKRIADKIEKDNAKKQAEIDKKNQEAAKKKAVEDAKRQKTLDDAAARLKAAQAAYQAEIDKNKKGGSH